MDVLIIKLAQELTEDEFNEINEAVLREFEVELPKREKLLGRQIFLIKRGDGILAMGQLLPISPILFNGETFSILGVGGIIANEKGQGHGKEIMTEIKEYLENHGKTGQGFCKLKNKGFYEKCGFKTDTSSLKRFVYKAEKEISADLENECIFYQDGKDKFMEKVLANPSKQVIIPTPPLW